MTSIGENWNCPYCGHAQVLSDKRVFQGWITQYGIQEWEDDHIGFPSLEIAAIACANSQCRKLTLTVRLAHAVKGSQGKEIVGFIKSWQLLPGSSAKPQPDFIPKAIRDDYGEACAIRDLSPKAFATITRRCLQGMIRDFCNISKSRLVDEIDELRKRVESGNAPLGVQIDSVEAIDAVRKIGNIGAHMEKDINVIVDVDPDEAQILIELVETLFLEWYVAADSRKKKFGHLKAIAADKEQKKKGVSKAGPTTASE